MAPLADSRQAFAVLRSNTAKIFAITLFAWVLANMDHSFFGYAVPGIIKEFDISEIAIAWILTAAFVFAAFNNLAMGLLADRYGRRVVLVGCLASSAAFVGLHALATGIFTLGILRAFGFALSNALSPISNAYVAEASPARYRGLMVGLLQCGFPLGWFVASLIAVPLMEEYSWRSIFLVAFAVVPIAFVIGKFLPESARFITATAKTEAGPSKPTWQERLSELFSPKYRRRTIFCLAAFFCFGGPYSGTAFYFPLFYTDVRGYTEAEAASIVGIAYGIGVFGYIGAAVIGEFVLTRRNTTIIWCWLGTASLLGLIWLPTTYAEDILWFGLMSTFFYGMAAVITTVMLELYPTRLRATGAAFAGTFGLNVGFATYPVLVAWLADFWGWQWAFTVSVVPTLFLSGVFLLGLANNPSGLDIDEISE